MLATEIDLQMWCHPDRPVVAKPFVRNGWRYATDGRAMVRLKATGEPDTAESIPGMPLPDAAVVFGPAESLTFALWPADWETRETTDADGEKEECPECHGETKKCTRCCGSGRIECGECEQNYDCPDCEGKGYIGAKCPRCSNRGTITKPGRAFCLAPGVWVEERFLRRVVSLPNLQYACQEPPAHKPVFFRFDGGEAAIMPITSPLPED